MLCEKISALALYHTIYRNIIVNLYTDDTFPIRFTSITIKVNLRLSKEKDRF